MDLDGKKRVCASCLNWAGRRECINGLVRVKASTKGACELLKKMTTAQGGCIQWQRRDGGNTEKG
jgi:hypothetical protein